MLQLRLVVHDVLDQYAVSGSIAGADEDGEWRTLASWNSIEETPEEFAQEDPTTAILAVVRQWSERTIFS